MNTGLQKSGRSVKSEGRTFVLPVTLQLSNYNLPTTTTNTTFTTKNNKS